MDIKTLTEQVTKAQVDIASAAPMETGHALQIISCLQTNTTSFGQVRNQIQTRTAYLSLKPNTQDYLHGKVQTGKPDQSLLLRNLTKTSESRRTSGIIAHTWLLDMDHHFTTTSLRQDLLIPPHIHTIKSYIMAMRTQKSIFLAATYYYGMDFLNN